MMRPIQSCNNNGLFRTKTHSTCRQKKKKYGRFSIRRSKIHDSIINNSSSEVQPRSNSFPVSYRPSPVVKSKQQRMNENPFIGAGDEQLFRSSSNQQKQIDFGELERIFDSAIQNKIPIELHKEQSHLENVRVKEGKSVDKISQSKLETYRPDTRVEITNQIVREPIKTVQQNRLIHKIKQHKIISTIVLVSLSAMTGFLTALIFIK